MSVSERTVATTPLQAIERAVLDRAKAIRLDLDDEAAAAQLRQLIEEEVARWSADYRRGLRSQDLADPELVTERGFRNLAGYGPLESLLEDDDVWEVMINGPDAVCRTKATFGVKSGSSSRAAPHPRAIGSAAER